MTVARRVFLAHASYDKPQVRKLYEELKVRGFDPWLDEKDLIPGQIWNEEIPKAIHEAGVFLACLSSRSVGKVGYVQNEFRTALSAFAERPHGSIYLIPVRLDDCEVPDLQIPDRGLSLRNIHWVDLWKEDGFDRLIIAIERTLPAGTPLKASDERRGPGAIDPSPHARSSQSHEPGSVFRDVEEPWCPEMIFIPAGNFVMGSPEKEADRDDAEGPQHYVQIAHRFALGRYPVTFEEYDRFAKLTGHRKAYDDGWGRGRHPVINVSRKDAQAYIAWLSKETGQPYHLPLEAEWEYACRAGTTTRYSWGDEITPENANYFDSLYLKTTDVGSYPANPWGLYDMHGNVWERVEDCWNWNYDDAPEDGSAWTDGDCRQRVLRGGSWKDRQRSLRSAYRDMTRAIDRVNNRGFRVAMTLR